MTEPTAADLERAREIINRIRMRGWTPNVPACPHAVDDARHIVASLIAAVRAEASAWRDIGSAPRDGTAIFVYRRCGGWDVVGTAYWANVGAVSGWVARGLFDPPGELGLAAPTHWLPLLARPEDC